MLICQFCQKLMGSRNPLLKISGFLGTQQPVLTRPLLGTSEHPSISLELDRDVLLVRVRTTSKTRTLIWRLLGKDDDNDKQDTDRSCVSNEAELRSITSSTSTRDRPQRRPRSSRINDAEAELQGLIDSLSDSASSTTTTMRTRYRTREPS